MNKDEEIEWLDNAITTLGPNSYLGITLKNQRDAIVRDIRCDILPLRFDVIREEQRATDAEMSRARQAIKTAQERLAALESQITEKNRKINQLEHLTKTHLTTLKEKAKETLDTIKKYASI
jgi:septal ring factor EnvC (AmiA/AmiB activator)